MHKVLLPVDGSRSAFEAALYLVHFVRQHGPIEVHVTNVQPRSLGWSSQSEDAGNVVGPQAIDAHLALKSVLHALSEAGIAYQTHLKLGDPATTLVALANELGCDHIVMGTRGLGAISGIVLGSVARDVLHLATVPVICVKENPGTISDISE
jgi:nucleotide-binding universal stress UspA family protein